MGHIKDIKGLKKAGIKLELGDHCLCGTGLDPVIVHRLDQARIDGADMCKYSSTKIPHIYGIKPGSVCIVMTHIEAPVTYSHNLDGLHNPTVPVSDNWKVRLKQNCSGIFDWT